MEYLNKTQKELESLIKFKFKFNIPFSDIFKIFKNDRNSIKSIWTKRNSRSRR